MSTVKRMSISLYSSILLLSALLIFICIQGAIAQESEMDEEISRYKAALEQNPDDAKVHRDLGNIYARAGMLDEAIEQFERAMEIEYQRGYEAGKRDAIMGKQFRIYGSTLILSIVAGLFIAAVILTILSWSEINDKINSMRRNARIRAYARGVGDGLSPELRSQAIEIAQGKEKLRDAINRETDSNLKEAAASVLPKLDDLTRQASLLLELQQNLSEHIKDVDPAKLDIARREAEEKLRKETDEEAESALQYQLTQMKNRRVNYDKATAKIRTCDAVLKGITARIDATSMALMSLPSVFIKKQEFFERVSNELDEEISLTRDAAESVMEETS
jgi:tetratricopeptide (TPR) repeat protein